MTEEPIAGNKRGRGYLAPTLVRGFAFSTITLCVTISVAASILANREYTVTEVLWRTVATCVVIAAGTGVFALLNRWFGREDGSNVQRLTEFETGAYTSWSPDGELIAFEGNFDGI